MLETLIQSISELDEDIKVHTSFGVENPIYPFCYVSINNGSLVSVLAKTDHMMSNVSIQTYYASKSLLPAVLRSKNLVKMLMELPDQDNEIANVKILGFREVVNNHTNTTVESLVRAEIVWYDSYIDPDYDVRYLVTQDGRRLITQDYRGIILQ